MTFGELWSAFIAMLGYGVRGTSNLLETYEVATRELKTAAEGIAAANAISRAKEIEALMKS